MSSCAAQKQKSEYPIPKMKSAIWLFVFFSILTPTFLLHGAGDETLFLKNPGFEDVTDEGRPIGWTCTLGDDSGGKNTITTDSDDKYSGERSLKICQEGQEAFSYALQTVKVEPGMRYTLTGYAKARDVVKNPQRGAGARIFITDDKATRELGHVNITDEEWSPVSMTFETRDCEGITIRCYLHYASGTAWFDDLKIEKTDEN